MGESFCYFLTEAELVILDKHLASLGRYRNNVKDLNWMEEHEIVSHELEVMYNYKLDVLSSEMGITYGIESNCKDLNNTSWSLASDLLKQVCRQYGLTVIKVSYNVDESPNKPKLYQYDTLLIPTVLLEFLQSKNILC